MVHPVYKCKNCGSMMILSGEQLRTNEVLAALRQVREIAYRRPNLTRSGALKREHVEHIRAIIDTLDMKQ